MNRMYEDAVSEPMVGTDDEYPSMVNTTSDDISGAVPCFLPDEMESLGVFSDDPADNCYNVRSDYVSEEWFHHYKETGDPGEDWYDKVSKVYKEYLLDKSDRNKQRLLEYGWNPEVEFCSENVVLASKFNRVRLNEAYSITMVDATRDYYIKEDGIVDSSESYLKYYSTIAMNVYRDLVELDEYKFAKGFIWQISPYFEDNGDSMIFAKYDLSKIEDNDSGKSYQEFLKLVIQTANNKIMQLGEIYYKLDEKTDENILQDDTIKIRHISHTGDLPVYKEEI